jgi:hypothetical protein
MVSYRLYRDQTHETKLHKRRSKAITHFNTAMDLAILWLILAGTKMHRTKQVCSFMRTEKIRC